MRLINEWRIIIVRMKEKFFGFFLCFVMIAFDEIINSLMLNMRPSETILVNRIFLKDQHLRDLVKVKLKLIKLMRMENLYVRTRRSLHSQSIVSWNELKIHWLKNIVRFLNGEVSQTL